jgi:hypothetical protein
MKGQVLYWSIPARQLDDWIVLSRFQNHWNREEQEARKVVMYPSILNSMYFCYTSIHHTVQFVAIYAISLSLSLSLFHPLIP